MTTYDLWLMLHFVGLALGVGASFALLTLGLTAARMEPAERGKFMQHASVLRKNGSFGLLLLVASGIGLMLDRGIGLTFLRGGGMFHAKLTLVLLLIILFGYSQVLAKRAREAPSPAALQKLGVLGRVMLAVGVAIIVLAVLAFH